MAMVRSGIVPENRRDGENFRVRSYGGLYDSVRAYMRNLNSHPAYRELRRERARLRNVQDGAKNEGAVLAQTLARYSGQQYVETLLRIIRVNRLQQFDDAQLSSKSWRQADDRGDAHRKATADRS